MKSLHCTKVVVGQNDMYQNDVYWNSNVPDYRCRIPKWTKMYGHFSRPTRFMYNPTTIVTFTYQSFSAALTSGTVPEFLAGCKCSGREGRKMSGIYREMKDEGYGEQEKILRSSISG